MCDFDSINGNQIGSRPSPQPTSDLLYYPSLQLFCFDATRTMKLGKHARTKCDAVLQRNVEIGCMIVIPDFSKHKKSPPTIVSGLRVV